MVGSCEVNDEYADPTDPVAVRSTAIADSTCIASELIALVPKIAPSCERAPCSPLALTEFPQFARIPAPIGPVPFINGPPVGAGGIIVPFMAGGAGIEPDIVGGEGIDADPDMVGGAGMLIDPEPDGGVGIDIDALCGMALLRVTAMAKTRVFESCMLLVRTIVCLKESF